MILVTRGDFTRCGTLPCLWELALQATAGASLTECPPCGRSRLQGKLQQKMY